MKNISLFISCYWLLLVGCNSKQQVDLIVHNAQVYTVDSAFTQVQAFAVKDGNIIALGSDSSILATYSSDSILNAQQQFVYPGFIDGHAHFLGYGQGLFQVSLFGMNSWQTIVDSVKAFAVRHPQETWIRGRGWDQNLFANKQYPDNSLLNQLFPDRPVLLIRVDGHAAIANAKALAIAGITPTTTLVGGAVETNNGKLTGVLIDNAVDLVMAKIPVATAADYEKWLLAAQRNCVATGLTTITDCGLMYNDVAEIDALQKNGKLQQRLYVMLSDDTANYNRYLSKGPYITDRLWVKGIKVYADGALGSRGACLLKHYADKPGWFGFLLKDAGYFDSLASVLVKTDFQMCTHAIGDSANRTVLKIYEKYLKGKNDKRWRIEHAQVVAPSDFYLFGNNSVVPSVQPTHATSDMYWAENRLGKERMAGAYAYQQLLQQNGWLPLGTDFPVEDISPFKTYLAAVHRVDAQQYPSGGFQVNNALTPEQALRGMTIWAAKANRIEQEVGSLEVGKRADFIILPKNILQVPAQEVLQLSVTATYINGVKVH
jgi:predicted amidohydrolase YtcJ